VLEGSQTSIARPSDEEWCKNEEVSSRDLRQRSRNIDFQN
jgi:hypothetical protein